MSLLPGTSRKTIGGTKYAEIYAPGVGLLLRGSTSGRTGILPHAAGPTIDYTLPETAPAADGYVLSSTTVGVLSWVAAGITIDSTPITSGGANRILFESGTNQVSSSANLTFTASAYQTLAVGSSSTVGAGLDLYPASGTEYILLSTGSGSIVGANKFAIYHPASSGYRVVLDSTGKFGINKTDPGAQLHVAAGSATTIGQIIQGAAAHTANLTEWRDSAGTGSMAVTSGFRLAIGDTAADHPLDVKASNLIVRNASWSLGGLSTGFTSTLYQNSGGQFYVGKDSNSGAGFGGTAYAAILWTNDTDNIELFTNQIRRMTLSGSSDDLYFGKGVTHATPAAYTINGTGGLGTDIAGAALNLAAGKSTGAATPAVLNFQTSDILTTGTTLQSLVTRFSVSASQSSPNATVHVASLIGGGTSTNVDIAIVPKGEGSFSLAVPDGALTGGDKRGKYAVDLQMGRDHVTEVASGFWSVLAGGYGNKSTGDSSVVSGGNSNFATGDYSFISHGVNNESTGNYADTGGNQNIATGLYSSARGSRANADKYSQRSWASGWFSARGDSQISDLVARNSTADATPTELFLDGSAATQRCTIASDTTWAFTITVVARRTDVDGESAAYEFKGCIDNNAGTTALVGSVTKTVLAEDTAAWDCDVTADDTNDALIITSTGELAKTIRWVARIELTEVTG